MANHAARKLRQSIENLERVIAIEFYTAAQGREFNAELRAGKGAEAAYLRLRQDIPALVEDRYMGPELDHAHELLANGALADAAQAVVGKLQA